MVLAGLELLATYLVTAPPEVSFLPPPFAVPLSAMPPELTCKDADKYTYRRHWCEANANPESQCLWA